MQLRQLFDDDDAVSPVIGVILMVAITVILAAVIATFVLGLGEQVSQTAPQSSFSFDYNSDSNADDDWSSSGDGVVTVSHAGGASITASNLDLTGSSVSNDPASWTKVYSGNSEISAGDSIDLAISSDDTIRVVWQSDNGQDSATLRTWSGPDA